jgi:hypothetical protein
MLAKALALAHPQKAGSCALGKPWWELQKLESLPGRQKLLIYFFFFNNTPPL